MATPSRRPPGTLEAAKRVFDLSLSDMLWSKRTVFMGLVIGLPVLLSLVVRVLHDIGLPNLRINNQSATGPVIFGLMVWVFFVRFAVPVLGVFYGTALIADEIDDKTITYLFARPIARRSVLLGKYLAYLACTIFVVLPGVVLVWLLVVPMGGSLASGFIDFVKDLAIIAAGFAVYGALFAFVGARFKRPLVIGLVYIFGWETFVLALPGSMKQLSIAYYLQGLVPQAMPNDSTIGLIQAIFRETPSLTESVAGLAIIAAVFLWAAMRTIERKEYVLEQ